MNHIYRTVWNKTLNTWVAAPESARAASKSASSVGGSVAVAPRASWRGVAAAIALLWGGLAGHQMALAQSTSTPAAGCVAGTPATSITCTGTVTDAYTNAADNLKVTIAEGATTAAAVTLSGKGHTVVNQGMIAGGMTLGGAGGSNFHAVTGSKVGSTAVNGGDHADTVLHLQNTAAAATPGDAEGAGTVSKATYTGFKTIKVQSGTWTLQGADAVDTGVTLELNGGKAVVTEDGNINGAAVLKSNNGTLVMGGTNARTVTNAIANTGSLTVEVAKANSGSTLGGVVSDAGAEASKLVKTGDGTLILGGVNTYTGVTEVQGGSLESTVANLGTTSEVKLAEGTSLKVTDAAAPLTRNVTGAGKLVKAGAGDMTLSGKNTHTGGTEIGATGTVTAAASALGTGEISFTEDATLHLDVTAANAPEGAELAQALTQKEGKKGNLEKGGNGTVVLTGNNTLTGTLDVKAGTLELKGNNAFGAVTVTDGTLKTTVAGLGAAEDDVVLTAATSVLEVVGAGEFKRATTADSEGKLVKSGEGELVLKKALAHKKETEVKGGTLKSTVANLGAVATSNVVVAEGAALNVDGAGDLTKVVSGAGGLVKSGAGELTLSGANTYTGATTVEAGTLKITAADKLGGTAGDAEKGVVIAKDAVLAVEGAAAVDLDKVVSGAGTLKQVGAQALTLSADNSKFAGVVDVTGAGGLTAKSAAALGTGEVKVAAGATLTVEEAATKEGTLAQVISGDGNLKKAEAGKLTLTGDNTFKGTVTVEAGTLELTGTNKFEGAVTVTDGTLKSTLSGLGKNADAITLTAATSVLEVADAGEFNRATAGAGKFVKSGEGELELKAVLAHTGGTEVKEGALKSTVANLGASAVAVAEGAALNVAVAKAATDDLTAVVSGKGGLVKSGEGALTLSGANTYEGATEVKAGLLKVADAAKLGGTDNDAAKGVAIAKGATLEIANTATEVELKKVLSGAGKLVKSGTQALTLSADNSGLTGVVDITGAGGVTAKNAAALGKGEVKIGADTLTVEQAADTTGTLAQVISGAGALKKTGTGTLVLAGANAYAGTTTVEAGKLVLAGEQKAGGDITVNAGADLAAALGDGVTVALERNIAGEGALALVGAGTLSVGAGKSVQGKSVTLAEGATLLQNGGTFKTDTLTVQGGTTLAGVGTIEKAAAAAAAVTVADKGVLRAGTEATPYGTLTIDGNLTMAQGSVLEVNVNPATAEAGKVAVTGTATLAGSVAHVGKEVVKATDFAEGAKEYTILTAGTLAGDFTGVKSDFRYVNASLAKEANDVKLKLERNATLFTDDAQKGNQNQTGVAQALDSLTKTNPEHEMVKYMLSEVKSAAQAQALFTELSGDTHASVTAGLSLVSHQGTGLNMQNLRHNLTAGMRAGAALAQSGGTMPASAMPTSKAQPLWVELVGQWQKADDTRTAPGLRQNTTGLFIGGDTEVAGTGWRVGGSLGYTRSDTKLNTRSASADMDSVTATVYAGKSFAHGSNRINVMGGLSHSRHNVESQRVALAGLYKANYNANSTQLFGEVGYAMGQYSGFALEPYVGVSLGQLHTDAFREAGGIAALETKSSNEDLSSLTLGMHMHNDTQFAGKSLRLRTSLGLRHNMGDVEKDRELRFAGAGNYFTVKGAPLSRTTGLFKLQGELELSRNATLELGYSGEFSGKSRDQSANVKMRWGF